MKTFNLIISIALLALATTASSQRSISSKEDQAKFVNVSYTIENSTIANKIGGFLDKFSRPQKAPSIESVFSMSFTMDQPDVVYEEAYTIESWMTAPFKYFISEVDMDLESWMTSPFNCKVSEADLPIESWMTAPFEAAESIKVESWMTSAWL